MKNPTASLRAGRVTLEIGVTDLPSKKCALELIEHDDLTIVAELDRGQVAVLVSQLQQIGGVID